MKQEYTSAKSSIKQVPAGFGIVDKYFGWQPNSFNFDIGGGKYNLMTEKLKEKNVTNIIYDPYNRTESENEFALTLLKTIKFHTVTIFNVLNVIKEYECQLDVIKLAYEALRPEGYVFVRSVYKNPNKRSGVTKSGTYQHYLTQEDYLKIVKEVFKDAVLKHGIIYAKK